MTDDRRLLEDEMETQRQFENDRRTGNTMRMFGAFALILSFATGLVSPWLMSKVPQNIELVSFVLVILAMMVYPMVMALSASLLAGLAPDRAYDHVQRNDTQVFLWVSFLMSGTSLLIIAIMPDPSGFFALFPSPTP